jgi:hypothetical protein
VVDILDRAEQFLWVNARLLDRLRFEYLFRGGSRERALAALRPYQNDDGGFGNAFEPDLRGPISQPEPVDVAVQMLDELDAMDDPMVGRLLGYLESITRPDGGVPFVLPSVRPYPRGPWWQTDDDPPGRLLPTAAIVGHLHRHGVKHPWVDRATDFCWARIEALTQTNPYEARAILPFLDHVPDTDRAEAAFDLVRPLILDGDLVEFDPRAKGEVHMPLDFAPTPQTLGRRLFSDAVIDEHLDALVAAQSDGGGWRFNWPVWTPVTEYEWGGWVTVRALKILRAYGRV